MDDSDSMVGMGRKERSFPKEEAQQEKTANPNLMEDKMKYLNKASSGISRREFLIHAGISSAMCILESRTGCRFAWASPGEDYYRSNRDRFTTSFENTISSAKPYLSTRYDAKTSRNVCNSARKEFAKLLPELPYIGGDQHPGTRWMLLAAHWISFMRPMNEQGYPEKSTARMMYDLYVQHLNTISKDKMARRGEYMFSPEYIGIMKNWTQRSKLQKVDWVADFIPGDGQDFDYGIDYFYCPCLAYFESQDAERIAPFFCLLDFPEHKLMGTGLVRKCTLARGDKYCDFRYKKGRTVTQNWATEVAGFK